jgi:hypothetical protein
VSPRGSTGLGKPSILPPVGYSPKSQVTGSIVHFVGEDGRSRNFDFTLLPLPGWHASLAASWAVRVGSTGSIRTLISAVADWGAIGRVMRHLSQDLRPPQNPSNLTVEHVAAFLRIRSQSANEACAKLDVRAMGRTFEIAPLADLVSPEVRDAMRPYRAPRYNPKSGYSDGELARTVAAARVDVAALRDRLLSSPPNGDEQPTDAVPHPPTDKFLFPGLLTSTLIEVKQAEAEKWFVTRRDMVPMLVLLVAMTGWNVEVMKELPAQHRVIEGLAVEVELTKRRRGSGRWHKELTTPGGVYLLLHRLMTPARDLSDDPGSFWAVWHHSGRNGNEGCRNPYMKKLNTAMRNQPWMHERDIRADADPSDPGSIGPILSLEFNRLKTSIDVRRTRQMGGHLPSAARSNSTGVLFSNYLAGDASTIDWARDLVAETLVEVEKAAWSAHRRALATHGVTDLQIRRRRAEDELEAVDMGLPPHETEVAAWTDCSDHEHHPLTGRKCSASFLDCFNCGNCVVTDDHLPGLLSLLDALELRRNQMSDDAWWARYGSSWAAIRFEVLPKFSEAEVGLANQSKPRDSLLDIVEPRWEQP